MRALKAKDLGPFTKVLAKIGIKDLLKDFIDNSSKRSGKAVDKSAVGSRLISDIAGLVIENYSNAEKELFEFLADINEKTVEEIADMTLMEFVGLIKELFSGENFPFFNLLSKTNPKSEES
jgi:hypothetical protein